jgi:divalent metal cation (Fe/Co/Zn/Cd) transporter
MYEGIHKLGSPTQVESPWLGISVLLVSVLLEAYSFKACIDEVRAQNTHGKLWRWFHRTTAAELLVIFTEDAAALLGLVIATVCLLLTVLTGNSDWDARGSVLIGTLLIIVAALLAVEIKSLLVGEAPATDYRPMLEELVGVHVPKGRLLRLIALQTGGSEVLLSYKIFPGDLKDVGDLVSAINDLEREVKRRFPEVRWQFVEPDDHA